jgi:putative PEP-CTERM system TPR-repeat lipoprotein
MKPTIRHSNRALAFTTALAISLTWGCSRQGPEAQLEKARTAIAAGETRAAEIHLKNVLQKSPDDRQARMMLASVYAGRRDFASAGKEWQRALELGAEPDLVLPGLLEARVLTGDPKGAIAEAGRHTLGEPGAVARAAYWTGRAHQAIGRAAEAEASYTAALTARPDLHVASVGLASVKAAQGDRAGAESLVDAVLAKAPSLPEGLLMKAELRLAAGDRDAARAALERAVEIDGSRVEPRLLLVSLLIDGQDVPAASRQLEGLRQVAPGHPTTLYLGAMLDFRQDRLDAARDGVQAALKVAPDYLPAIALAGNVALAQGSLEVAEQHARKLSDLAPNAPAGARLLASIQLRRNEPDRALQTAKAVLARGVSDPVLFGIAGEAALRRNDFPTAISFFERAARLDPSNAARRTGLGLAQLAAGRTDAGFESLEAAATLDGASTQADLALIDARIRARQFDQALAAIDRLAKKKPEAGIADGLRGTVYLAKNDRVQARESFESALRREPSYYPAIANLVNLDVRDGKAADARARLEALVQKDPRNVQVAVALADLIVRTGGKPDEAERILKQARSANPNDVEAAVALARLQIQTNRARDAIPMLQQMLGQQPDDRRLLNALGTAYVRAQDTQQAIETFEKLVALDPRSAAAHQRLGEIKSSLGDPTGAAVSFRQAAALDPKAAGPQIALASMLMKEGRTEQARGVAVSLQKDLPASPAGLALEGDLLASEQKWSAAADAYRKALAVERSAPLVIKHHRALMQARRDADAAAALADALKRTPNDPMLRGYAGEVAVQARQWGAAAEHYRTILATSPNNVVALNNLAWSLRELRDPSALKYAEEAYRLAPGSPAVIDTLAMIVGDAGNAKRAVELMKEAVAKAPGSPMMHLHYAESLAKAGDRDAARATAEAILQKFPDAAEAGRAKQLLSRL